MTRSRPSLDQILRQPHLPALDTIRALSVMMVIAGHFGYEGVSSGLGVSAFFVLSGFLITLLLFREGDRTGAVSLRGFYARRALRIFPAYYAFLAFSATWDLVHHGKVWPLAERIGALTYTINYVNAANGHTSAVAHAWSLAVEEQFYLLWPMLFLAVRRRGARTQAIATTAILLLVVAWRSWLYLGRGVGSAYVYNAFDTRFDSLLTGCLLAILLRAPQAVRAAGAIARSAWMPLATIALLVASQHGSGAYHYSVGFTIDAVLLAALIVQWMQLEATAAWRWLAWRPLRWIGTISYPMYLYHLNGLDLAAKVHGVPHAAQLAIGTVATIVLAWCSYTFIERPFLRLKSRIGRGATPALAPAAPVTAAQDALPAPSAA